MCPGQFSPPCIQLEGRCRQSGQDLHVVREAGAFSAPARFGELTFSQRFVRFFEARGRPSWRREAHPGADRLSEKSPGLHRERPHAHEEFSCIGRHFCPISVYQDAKRLRVSRICTKHQLRIRCIGRIVHFPSRPHINDPIFLGRFTKFNSRSGFGQCHRRLGLTPDHLPGVWKDRLAVALNLNFGNAETDAQG